MSTRLPRVTHGSIALVGDASGAVDAVTGTGLSLAFQQAAALAAALAAGDLAVYERAHARIARAPRLAARLLLQLGSHHRWHRHVMHALATSPNAFTQLLRVHTGELGLARGAPVAGWVALRAAVNTATFQAPTKAAPPLVLNQGTRNEILRGDFL